MGKGKKKKYVPFYFETKDGKQYTRLFFDSLCSDAFLSLKKSQRCLYLYMRMQQGYVKELEYNQFYFNQYLWLEKYKLYSNEKTFYKDRDALISKGFIKIAKDENGCLCDGKNTRSKSIYEYSDEWKHYGTEAFKIAPSDMPLSMRKKDAKK